VVVPLERVSERRLPTLSYVQETRSGEPAVQLAAKQTLEMRSEAS
jgi:hypothetical protein